MKNRLPPPLGNKPRAFSRLAQFNTKTWVIGENMAEKTGEKPVKKISVKTETKETTATKKTTKVENNKEDEKVVKKRTPREEFDYDAGVSYGIYDLADAVRERVGEDSMTKSLAHEFARELFYTMDDILGCGSDVKIVGFGKFFTKLTTPRPVRNPANGESLIDENGQPKMSDPRWAVKFSPAFSFEASAEDIATAEADEEPSENTEEEPSENTDEA